MRLARIVPVSLVLLMLAGSAALAANGDCRLIRGATTPDTTDDVSVCRQDTWIHQATTKFGNAPAYGIPNAGTEYPSWNTTPPADSVQDGAGGGYLSLAAYSQNTSYTDPKGAVTFRGSFTGNLDNIAAKLFLFSPVRSADATQAVSMRLNIDNTTIYQTGDAADRTPLTPGGDAVLQTNFAFVDLYKAMDEAGLALGDTVVHTVELVIGNWFTVNDNALYVYDTTEVPAGLVFNLDAGLGSYAKFIPNQG
ncbi:MAG: hypothetical protein ACRDH9_12180 [Actinomycetota bacterium]